MIIDKLKHYKLHFCNSFLVSFMLTFFFGRPSLLCFFVKNFSFEKIKVEKKVFFRNVKLQIEFLASKLFY